jgi:hypothetical protein
MKVYLSKPTRKFKKYSILIGHKKSAEGVGSNTYREPYASQKMLWRRINFGDDRYEDYTQHQDPKRKALYIQRHKKNEDWNNPLTAGFWSRYLLWEKPTISEAKKYIFNKFGIMVV